MDKVYCSKCRFYKKNYDKIKWHDNEIDCFHPTCFEGEIRIIDKPDKAKKIDCRHRCITYLQKNSLNNCEFFQSKFNLFERFKKESKQEKENKDVTIAKLRREIEELTCSNNRYKIALDRKDNKITDLCDKNKFLRNRIKKRDIKEGKVAKQNIRINSSVFSKIDID